MKKLVISLIVAGLGLATISLAAQTRNISPLSSSGGILEKIKERAQISTEEFQQNREQLKQLMEQNQIEFRNQIQQKREEMAIRIKSLGEQLRTRLKERIKNVDKQKIVERVYESINALNEKMTKHYLNVLERLEKILEKIESRTAKAKLNGIDVSLVEMAINDAKTKISNAKEAVNTQAGKIYQPPEITTEESLKLDVGKLRQQLHDDLKAVEKLVKDAREAVHQAAILLGQIPRIDTLEVPTVTPTTQPTP